jgi:thymidylate synthase (FAD)
MSDYTKVKLISYSCPSDIIKQDGLDDIQDLVAFCARVSNPSNQYNTETSDRLINYLIKHAHWSPFEMANICLEIETTRDISRQILRHRSFNFQEFSGRYADPVKELNFVTREARLQDNKNRQNSLETDNQDLQTEWKKRQEQQIELAKENYRWALDNGIAKEQARAVLPEGCTMTRLYMNGTIRSWIHYCQVRCKEDTQKEHRFVAKACAEAIAELFPMINKVL